MSNLEATPESTSWESDYLRNYPTTLSASAPVLSRWS